MFENLALICIVCKCCIQHVLPRNVFNCILTTGIVWKTNVGHLSMGMFSKFACFLCL